MVILGDEPQLGFLLVAGNVRRYKGQDVVVTEPPVVIDVGLPLPGALLSGGENLHSHIVPLVNSTPHLPITTFTWGIQGIQRFY